MHKDKTVVVYRLSRKGKSEYVFFTLALRKKSTHTKFKKERKVIHSALQGNINGKSKLA